MAKRIAQRTTLLPSAVPPSIHISAWKKRTVYGGIRYLMMLVGVVVVWSVFLRSFDMRERRMKSEERVHDINRQRAGNTREGQLRETGGKNAELKLCGWSSEGAGSFPRGFLAGDLMSGTHAAVDDEESEKTTTITSALSGDKWDGRYASSDDGGEGRYFVLTVFAAELARPERCGFRNNAKKPCVSLLVFVGDEKEDAATMADGGWSARTTRVAMPPMRCVFRDDDASGRADDDGDTSMIVDATYESGEFYHTYAKIACPVPEKYVDVRAGEASPNLPRRFSLRLELRRRAAVASASAARDSEETDDTSDTTWVMSMPTIEICSSSAPSSSSSSSSLTKKTEKHAASASAPARVSACVRPVSFTSLFAPTPTLSFAALTQWLVYHIDILKIDTVYLLDRFGVMQRDGGLGRAPHGDSADREDFMRRLHAYEAAGRVDVVYFPFFSEMQYRRGVTTTRLSLTYDQNIAYEYCLMMGRARGDSWMAFLDTDEYLRLSSVPSAVSSSTASVSSSPTSLAEGIDAYLRSDVAIANFGGFGGASSVAELYVDRFDMTARPPDDSGDISHHMLRSDSTRTRTSISSVLRRFPFRSSVAQVKGRSILRPSVAQVMFMHAHVLYNTDAGFSTSKVTVWPAKGGVYSTAAASAASRTVADAANSSLLSSSSSSSSSSSMALEIAHLTCLQVVPADDAKCRCPEAGGRCALDEGVSHLADAVEDAMAT